jgi:ribosomal-protein-alanine N-acetyltransferase
MQIEPIAERDLPEIISLIKREFPYVEIRIEKIRERIASRRVFVFKAVENKELLGFVEAEMLAPSIARINGLTVKPEERNKGIATALLEHMIDFLQSKGAKRIMLLVKQGNDEAKKLYETKGFKFMGLYQRQIDQSIVEEMELDLGTKEESPSYVS